MQLFSMQWCSVLAAAFDSILTGCILYDPRILMREDAHELISKLPMACVFFRCTQYGGEKLCADVILKKISYPSQNRPM